MGEPTLTPFSAPITTSTTLHEPCAGAGLPGARAGVLTPSVCASILALLPSSLQIRVAAALNPPTDGALGGVCHSALPPSLCVNELLTGGAPALLSAVDEDRPTARAGGVGAAGEVVELGSPGHRAPTAMADTATTATSCLERLPLAVTGAGSGGLGGPALSLDRLPTDETLILSSFEESRRRDGLKALLAEHGLQSSFRLLSSVSVQCIACFSAMAVGAKSGGSKNAPVVFEVSQQKPGTFATALQRHVDSPRHIESVARMATSGPRQSRLAFQPVVAVVVRERNLVRCCGFKPASVTYRDAGGDVTVNPLIIINDRRLVLDQAGKEQWYADRRGGCFRSRYAVGVAARGATVT